MMRAPRRVSLSLAALLVWCALLSGSRCEEFAIAAQPDVAASGSQAASASLPPAASFDTPSLLRFEQSPAEKAFHALLRDQLDKEARLTEHAKRIPRPAHTVELTLPQLATHDGRDPDTPIYVAIRRRVYDITDGWKYYGPEGRYHYLAGKEVGRAMATGCFETTGLTFDVRGLTDAQLDVVRSWQDFYASRYKHVGYLRGKKADDGSPIPDDECEESGRYGGRPLH